MELLDGDDEVDQTRRWFGARALALARGVRHDLTLSGDPALRGGM